MPFDDISDMRVYLDNCCYNRPFDEQDDMRVVLETLAKLQVQAKMRLGLLEYVWSDTLCLEVSHNPIQDRRDAISAWLSGASIFIESSDDVVERGREIEQMGVKPKDALHLASAEKANCDWFLTTDKGILKKVRQLGDLRVANPVEFMVWEKDNDEHL